VAQLGKVGTGELEKVGEYCTSIKQEIEADVVSARFVPLILPSPSPFLTATAFFDRLLAHAGYDARKAVTFWENRSANAECSSAERSTERQEHPSSSFVHKIMGSRHPVNEVRVNSLKGELLRWETERRAELRRQTMQPQDSQIVLATA
jgi:hypothetical protein